MSEPIVYQCPRCDAYAPNLAKSWAELRNAQRRLCDKCASADTDDALLRLSDDAYARRKQLRRAAKPINWSNTIGGGRVLSAPAKPGQLGFSLAETRIDERLARDFARGTVPTRVLASAPAKGTPSWCCSNPVCPPRASVCAGQAPTCYTCGQAMHPWGASLLSSVGKEIRAWSEALGIPPPSRDALLTEALITPTVSTPCVDCEHTECGCPCPTCVTARGAPRARCNCYSCDVYRRRVVYTTSGDPPPQRRGVCGGCGISLGHGASGFTVGGMVAGGRVGAVSVCVCSAACAAPALEKLAALWGGTCESRASMTLPFGGQPITPGAGPYIGHTVNARTDEIAQRDARQYYACRDGGCPDRDPVPADSPPTCYTCGRPMSIAITLLNAHVTVEYDDKMSSERRPTASVNREGKVTLSVAGGVTIAPSVWKFDPDGD